MGTFGRRKPGTIVTVPGLSDGLGPTTRQSERQSATSQVPPAVRPAGTPAHTPTQVAQSLETLHILAANAFAVLAVPIDADQDRISQAVDDLAFDDDRSETALQAARASLLSARERITQEVAWFPECTAEQQSVAASAVRRNDDTTLSTLVPGASGLALINLLEVVSDLRATNVQPAMELIDAICGWRPEITLDRIDEARGRGGFRPVDLDQWETCVQRRLEQIAARLGPLFAGSPDGRGYLTGLMHRDREPGSTQAMLMEALQAAYAAAIEAPLARLEIRIQAMVQQLGTDPSNTTQINGLIAALSQWSGYRRPIQVLEASRSLDDHESARIFDTVLELSITISNTHNRHAVALRLAQALLDCFSHVPQKRKRLERQLPVLEANLAVEEFGRLGATIISNRGLFVLQVRNGRMGPRSKGLAKQLLEQFQSTLMLVGEDRSVAFVLAREVIVSVHHKARDRQATRFLIKWLLAEKPPEEMRKKLEEDQRSLSGMRKSTRALVGLIVVLWLVAKCAGPHRADATRSSATASPAASVREPTQSAATYETQAQEKARILSGLREQIRQSELEAARIRAQNAAQRAGMNRPAWEASSTRATTESKPGDWGPTVSPPAVDSYRQQADKGSVHE